MARRAVPPARLAALLALGLLASAGCGDSRERELFEQRRAACDALHGKTIREARQALSQFEVLLPPCDASQARLGGDTCGGSTEGDYLEPVCQLVFQWATNDPGLCSPRSCVYACEVRSDQARIEALGTDAPICAVRFLPPQ